ncbi:unnamed protein product [Pleuronectes platessa]|uniref:Uncharacterized protein n=1 Tax=Pleuronectes platessa TaxID=8262 RepID=A0A9N7U8F9_PLEPL|nr:unnamed protein product [Pleuronectes platessa]
MPSPHQNAPRQLHATHRGGRWSRKRKRRRWSYCQLTPCKCFRFRSKKLWVQLGCTAGCRLRHSGSGPGAF